MTSQDLTSVLIIAGCVAGIAYVSRANFLANRDAGGGWRYIYWQPWRKWVIGFGVVLLLASIVLTIWAGSTKPIETGQSRLSVPVQPGQ